MCISDVRMKNYNIMYHNSAEFHTCILAQCTFGIDLPLIGGIGLGQSFDVVTGSTHATPYLYSLTCLIFLSRNFADMLSLGLGTLRKRPSDFSRLSKFFLRKRASSTEYSLSLSLSRGGELSGDTASTSSAEVVRGVHTMYITCVCTIMNKDTYNINSCHAMSWNQRLHLAKISYDYGDPRDLSF